MCIFPAGTYKSGQLNVLSGSVIRGAGPSVVILQTTGAANSGVEMFDVTNKSGVNIRGMTLLGPSTDGHMHTGADCGCYMEGVSNVTLQDMWFNYWTFGMRASSGTNSNISVIDCKTLSGNMTSFFVANLTGLHISGCDFDSSTINSNDDPGGPSHHLYTAINVTDVLVENTTLRNSYSWSVQIYPGPDLTDMEFKNITMTNVRGGVVIQSASGITFDGFTGSSNRYEAGSWFSVSSSSSILVKNAEVWNASIGTGFTTENVTVH